MSENFKFVINIQEATAHLITGQTKVCLENYGCLSPYMHFHNVYEFMSVPSSDCIHNTLYILHVYPFGRAAFIQDIRAHIQIFRIFTHLFCFYLYLFICIRVFSLSKPAQSQHGWKYAWVIVDLLIIFCHALNMNENISVSAVSLCLYRAWIMAVC